MRYAKLFCFQKIQYVLIEYYLSTFGVCVPGGQVKCRNPRSVRIIDPLEECSAGPGHDLLRNSALSQTGPCLVYTCSRPGRVGIANKPPPTHIPPGQPVLRCHDPSHVTSQVTLVTNHSQCSAIITLPRWLDYPHLSRRSQNIAQSFILCVHHN